MSGSSDFVKFTGLVQQMGLVTDIKDEVYVTIQPLVTPYRNLTLEESIAVDGRTAYVTVIDNDKENRTIDLQVEIQADKCAVPLRLNDHVNLERSLTNCSRIEGIFMLGVVDGNGKVTSIEEPPDDISLVTIYSESDRVITNVAVNGIVIVNGVALKVVSLDVPKRQFQVDLYPHTKKITNLGLLKVADCVNIEVDVLSKYVLGGYTLEAHARMAQAYGYTWKPHTRMVHGHSINWEHDFLGKHVARHYPPAAC